MKAVNIYSLTRVSDWHLMNLMEQQLSNRSELLQMREHEWQGIVSLVDQLALATGGLSLPFFDSFYLGYRIPHIGKEFDLLRIGRSKVINIELKSRVDDLQDILDQLRKNRYYLENLSRDLDLYTYNSGAGKLYRLHNDNIEEVSFSVLAGAMKMQGPIENTNLDDLFSPGNFLISPITTPERFLNHEYFLTSHQQFIKREILNLDNSSQSALFIGIKGRPGTGKSLLLYDIALEFAREESTLMIHCGDLPKGLQRLNRAMAQSPALLDIASLYDLSARLSATDYRYIFVDEAHRMTVADFDLLLASQAAKGCQLYFSYDPKQVMTIQEFTDDISGRIEGHQAASIFNLTTNIRFNTEIAAFLQNLMDLCKRNRYKVYHYPLVDLYFAATREEVLLQLDDLQQRGYTFINYVTNLEEKRDSFAQLPSAYDSYTVIGQEFDQVVMVLSDIFYYDDCLLQAKAPFDTDFLYTQMLYQGISRARGRLALIVWDDQELLEKILPIVTGAWPDSIDEG